MKTANQDKTIVVTGATGRQGGAVVRHLIQNNFPVRALTRTPGSIPAQQLTAMGATLVKADMADLNSLQSAFKDCYGVFSVQNYFEYGGEKEVQYGKNMIDAAKKTKVSHFIYSSVCNAGDSTKVPHFETKYAIEQCLKEAALPATIVRPVKFMENYYIPQVFKGILSGKLFDSIMAGKKHQLLAVDDVGALVTEAFQDPGKYLGQTIELASEELTNEEIAVTITEVLGKPVKFKRLPLLVAKMVMDKEMYLMFKWFNDKGFTADTASLKTNYPGLQLTSFKNWLIHENWQRWNKKGTV